MVSRIAQQGPPFDDIRPMVFAWVVHAHQHLHPSSDLDQSFQTLPGQRAKAEYDDAAGQIGPLSLLRPFPQNPYEALMHTGAASVRCLLANIGQNVTPQSGLPALVRIQGARLATAAELILARGPVCQPVRAVYLILVEKVG